jgi:hypothetical protein
MGQQVDINKVLRIVENMDERLATFLRLRFGLRDEAPLKLGEIGAWLGLTRSVFDSLRS